MTARILDTVISPQTHIMDLPWTAQHFLLHIDPWLDTLEWIHGSPLWSWIDQYPGWTGLIWWWCCGQSWGFWVGVISAWMMGWLYTNITMGMGVRTMRRMEREDRLMYHGYGTAGRMDFMRTLRRLFKWTEQATRSMHALHHGWIHIQDALSNLSILGWIGGWMVGVGVMSWLPGWWCLTLMGWVWLWYRSSVWKQDKNKPERIDQGEDDGGKDRQEQEAVPPTHWSLLQQDWLSMSVMHPSQAYQVISWQHWEHFCPRMRTWRPLTCFRDAEWKERGGSSGTGGRDGVGMDPCWLYTGPDGSPWTRVEYWWTFYRMRRIWFTFYRDK